MTKSTRSSPEVRERAAGWLLDALGQEERVARDVLDRLGAGAEIVQRPLGGVGSPNPSAGPAHGERLTET